jgi:hypothetical protein
MQSWELGPQMRGFALFGSGDFRDTQGYQNIASQALPVKHCQLNTSQSNTA